jgi:hypothetical protein
MMEPLVYVPRKSVRSYRAKGYEPVPDCKRDWAVLMRFVGTPTEEPVEKTYKNNFCRAAALRFAPEPSQTPDAIKQRRLRAKRKMLAEASA